MTPSKPEEKARTRIDQMLEAAGWSVQNYKDIDLDAGLGVAVREFMFTTGPADYALFVDGKAIGVVTWQPGQTFLLNDQRNALSAVIQTPKFYIPTRDFALSLADPPKPGEPLKLPWMGVTQMTGLTKDVAEAYGLANQPAVQIGDVIPNQPGAKGGLVVLRSAAKRAQKEA